MATIKTAKRPTRKHYLCFMADFRGYLHQCSKLTWSEHDYRKMHCSDPYTVGNKAHTNVC